MRLRSAKAKINHKECDISVSAFDNVKYEKSDGNVKNSI